MGAPLSGKTGEAAYPFCIRRHSDFDWSFDGKQLLVPRGHINRKVLLISNFHQTAQRRIGLFLWWSPFLFCPSSGTCFYSEFPRTPQGTAQYVFARLCESNVRHSHPAPASFDGHEYFRKFCDKVCLQFRGEHEVAIALGLWASVAKIRPPMRKSGDPMCELSSAPSKLRAMRRKSAAVIEFTPSYFKKRYLMLVHHFNGNFQTPSSMLSPIPLRTLLTKAGSRCYSTD